jgi:hypothetical protein
MKRIFLTLFLLALSTGILAQEKSTVTVDVKPSEGKKATVKDILEYFADEPTIQEVQAAAVEYAAVHPDKMRKWRKRAKYKAWLPKASVDWYKFKEEDTHWKSSTYRGTMIDRKWSAGLDWDLSDLIWNYEQYGIEYRSQLMVKLRNDVLDEVTRTYFERRRLQVEMLLSPPEDMQERIEQEMRIQELAGYLDAYTGGYFFQKLKEAKEKKEKQTK